MENETDITEEENTEIDQCESPRNEEGNFQESQKSEQPPKPKNMSPGAVKLRSWLNKTLKIKMTDGRSLIGTFLCTDRDANIILGSCSEYLPEDEDEGQSEDPRILGLVMVPGKHIVSICIDKSSYMAEDELQTPLNEEAKLEDIT